MNPSTQPSDPTYTPYTHKGMLTMGGVRVGIVGASEQHALFNAAVAASMYNCLVNHPEELAPVPLIGQPTIPGLLDSPK